MFTGGVTLPAVGAWGSPPALFLPGCWSSRAVVCVWGRRGAEIRGGQAMGVGQLWGTAQLGLLQLQGAWDRDIAYTLMCYPGLLCSEGSSTR